MTQTENRLPETNGEEAPEVSIEEQSRRAQAVLDAHRQSRVMAAERELQELLKRHKVHLDVHQIIAVVLNP